MCGIDLCTHSEAREGTECLSVSNYPFEAGYLLEPTNDFLAYLEVKRILVPLSPGELGLQVRAETLYLFLLKVLERHSPKAVIQTKILTTAKT